MDRRRGTGQVIDLVDLGKEGMNDVVAHELEIGVAQKVADVVLVSGEEVVHAQDIMPSFQKKIAEMASDEPGTARNQNARHKFTLVVGLLGYWVVEFLEISTPGLLKSPL
jgi:hypothetical protein